MSTQTKTQFHVSTTHFREMKMKFSASKQLLAASLAISVFIGNTTSAQAITFTLNNVQFSDNGTSAGTAEGTFDYDSINGYTNWNITVNQSDVDPVNFPTQIYSTATSTIIGSSNASSVTFENNDSFRLLTLLFNPTLTDTGVLFDLSGSEEDPDFVTTRDIVSGTVSSEAVPFEFSPSLGLVVLGGIFGANKLRKKVNLSKANKLPAKV